MEVWSLLIPLFVWYFHTKHENEFQPIIIYIWITLVIYSIINIITYLYKPLHFPVWLQSNNWLYNLHSIVRLLLFSMFFINLNQPFLVKLKKIIPILFILFVIINFSFFEYFFSFEFMSSRLLAVESGILLFYCLQFYFFIFLKEDNWSLKDTPSFWIVTGLSILIVISFPIYIFYVQLVLENKNFGIDIWRVLNLAFLVFCIFTAIGFYKSRR